MHGGRKGERGGNEAREEEGGVKEGGRVVKKGWKGEEGE